ncbi:MAG: alpha/beta fold hydrolase [Acidimicrobiales bacterium]
MSRRPSRPLRTVALAGAAALTVAGVVMARQRRQRQPPTDATDPSSLAGSTLPEGQAHVVTTADGADLAVLVAGPDDGPTVVLAHCWTGMRAIWAIVARHLVLGGHRVVLYDQRGHGQSTLGDLPPSIEVLAHDLRTVLEAVDARDIVLAGHSMGGMSIQSYAREHPADFAERVRAVVLVATAARVLGRPLPAAAVNRLMADGRAEWTRRGTVGHRLARGALGQQASREHVALTLEGLAATTGTARAGFLVAMASMDLRDAGPTLGQVPTTILVGTRDTLTPPRLGRQLAAGIPGADLHVIPGAGHMLPLESPDRIVDVICATTAPG